MNLWSLFMCSIGHKRKYKKGIAEAFLEYKTEGYFSEIREV